VEKETIPTGSFKKKVKAGADIAAAGTVLYATKGNKSDELWMYSPAAFAPAPMADRDGVEGSSFIVDRSSFSVEPNPLASGFATVSFNRPLDHSTTGALLLSVFDITGRAVKTQNLALGRSGSFSLDLRALSAGVYLVEVETDGFTARKKLVVQR
jgi:hypothetical protein